MDEQTLSLSFTNSITEEMSAITEEYVELGLDALVEEGLFKDIPIVSTAVSVYRIGKSIRERHHIAKLISFLNEFNKGIDDEEKRQSYRDKFASNEKFRNQELEYILILIDRYISIDKPQMLAKLYLAYLDGKIIWEEFTMYAEVIDRFLLLDCGMLTSNAAVYIVPIKRTGDIIQRLVALGLLVEDTKATSLFHESKGHFAVSSESMKRFSNDERHYVRTEFGDKLANILR